MANALSTMILHTSFHTCTRRIRFAPSLTRELKREKTWARIHLVPLLQAETDRDTYRRFLALQQRESEIMSGVEGWVAGSLKEPVPGLGKQGKLDDHAKEPVYHTKRYVGPIAGLFEEGSGVESAPWDAGVKVAKV